MTHLASTHSPSTPQSDLSASSDVSIRDTPHRALYGLPPAHCRRKGIRLVLSTDEICHDDYAVPLAQGIAALAQQRHPDRRIVAIDLFAGTANVLYQLAQHWAPLAALGYESHPLRHALTSNNLRMLGDTSLRLRDGNCEARLPRDLAAHLGRGHLFVVHIPRSRESRPPAPLSQVVAMVCASLADEHLWFAFQEPEPGDPELDALASTLELQPLAGTRARLGIPQERLHAHPGPSDYGIGFREFLARTPQAEHHLDWLQQRIDWTGVEHVLSIGCGTGAVELSLATSRPGLTLVCVEPDEGFADIVEAAARTRGLDRVRVARRRFEDFEAGAQRFDLVLMSHSLYYMEDPAEQLDRAASLLSERGELVIFHIRPDCNLRQFQRRFGVHNRYGYTSADVCLDLADRGWRHTEESIDIPTDIRDYPDALSTFLMERPCSSRELAEIRDYFADEFADSWPNQSSIIRVGADQMVAALSRPEFARCFATFASRSTEYQGMQSFLTQQLSGARSLLSIGCGDGQLDLPCLRAADTLERYVGIDPNGDVLRNFRAQLERAPVPDGLRIELSTRALEELDGDEHFDLILISHVLYYVEDKAALLRAALARLSPGGSCVVFHQTNIGINRIQKTFQSFHHRASSHDVQDVLDQLGTQYRMTLIDAHIDVAPLPDEMIQFFLERKCTTEELDAVRSYFETEVGERLYHPVCAFVVQASIAAVSEPASDGATSAPRSSRDAFLRDQRTRQPRTVAVAGLRIWEAHNVFSPAIGLTSLMMAKAVATHAMFTEAETFVDLGTGTGLLAIVAAKAGIEAVTALDIHRPAVACALYNVQDHGLGARIEVLESDLFEALGPPDQRFAAGSWNQPFYQAEDGLMGLDHDPMQLNRRFLEEAVHWFRPGAPILMAYSTVAGANGGPNDPRPLASALGYQIVHLGTETDDGPSGHSHQIFALLVPASVTGTDTGRRGRSATTSSPTTASPLQRQLRTFLDHPMPERGPMLPADLYRWDPLEHDMVERNWFVLGATGELPAARSYRERRFGRQSLIVTRDDHGQAHVLRNFCPHRGSCLVERGAIEHSRSRITCPYHQWGFQLSGERISSPGLDPCADDLPTGLQVAAHVAHTSLFTFGHLSAAAPVPLSARLPGFEDFLDSLGLSSDAFELTHARTYPIAANWLLVMENGLDTYHIPGVHPKTLYPLVDKRDSHLHLQPTRGQWLCGHYRQADADSAESAFLATLNAFAYAVGADHLSASIAVPIDATHTELHNHLIARKGADPATTEAIWQLLHQVMEEDVELLVRFVQPGAEMRQLAGRYHEPDSAALLRYHQLVARAFLAPDDNP